MKIKSECIFNFWEEMKIKMMNKNETHFSKTKTKIIAFKLIKFLVSELLSLLYFEGIHTFFSIII
jgi:hypothetical protein